MRIKRFSCINLFVVLILSISCSDDDSGSVTDPLNISLKADKSSYEIDERVTVTVSSNKALKEIRTSLDDFETSQTKSQNFGQEVDLYFSFESIGSQRIYIQSTDEDDLVNEMSLLIEVTRGMGVKIQNLKITSFVQMNGTWDPEFANDDPNRLADPFFIFQRQRVAPFTGNGGYSNWFRSDTLENLGSLSWDLDDKNLYLDPTLEFKIAVADADGAFVQDILQGPPSDRVVDLSPYTATKPEIVTISYPDVQFEMDLTVDWP